MRRSSDDATRPAGANRRDATAASSWFAPPPARNALSVTTTDAAMTTIDSTTNTIDRVPCTKVLRTTASIAATSGAVPNDVSPAARASLNARCCAQYPAAGTSEKIFSNDARW